MSDGAMRSGDSTGDGPDSVRPGSPGAASDAVRLDRNAPRSPANGKATPEKPPTPEPKDAVRDLLETVVFVVVLVLMLKTFLAEAFVIPTGSMATTLLGYHKDVVCRQCGYSFRANCSTEAEPQDGRREDVVSADCPNCRFRNGLR